MIFRIATSFLYCGLAVHQLQYIQASSSNKKYNDVPCEWTSLSGVSFDLKPLTKAANDQSYFIKDGDIPCTPETEPTFSYLWNFCSKVTSVSYPDKTVCDESVEQGAVLQYINRADGYKECHVIGRYDSNNDDLYYKLLSERNPALGLSMTYPLGESCPNGVLRSATLDVKCANVEWFIDSAQEPSPCQYHLVMESYHACPKECPITANGLCNSHGHCHFDETRKEAYCYCNDGYGGSACSDQASVAGGSYDGKTVQIALMSVLLIITIGLTATISWLIYQVTTMRREKLLEGGGNYSSLSDGSSHGSLMKGGAAEMTSSHKSSRISTSSGVTSITF